MAAERVRFPAAGDGGPILEGELWRPDGEGAVPGVVVAHPHPQRGGSMDNNVVMAICQGLNAAGIAALRFNFRGVGGSGGTYGEGVAEIADVLGALTFIAEQPGIAPHDLGLAGYSFGARASLAAAQRTPALNALLCVAPPLREPLPPAAIPACPLLVLIGDRDGLVAQGVDTYASYLPDPQVVRVVEGTDHFWQGFEPIVTEATSRFFTGALTPRSSGATRS
jgi:alpha/beta superfamily hydrolase